MDTNGSLKNDRSDISPSDEPKRKRPRTEMEVDPQCWTVNQTAEFLSEKCSEETIDSLRKEKITGKDLLQLNETHLEKIGISTLGQRLELMRVIQGIQFAELERNDSKIFNDPIHGHIDMHPLCVKIIDTPQFQRLRYIKQLGGCYFVFPGASHCRFEHSLGVCHLAGQLVCELRMRQPNLGITDADVLCVQIAGLCHDLGHGPFSHMFDGLFIPSVRPDSKWQHERASVDMFDYLVEDNNLMPMFSKFGLTKQDIKFIKEQIAGPMKRMENKKEWPFEGRHKNKSFLYEVVANKRNGIDVDKWDYFARDCHHLGISTNFDHSRFMKFSRVINDGGEMQICNRDKEVGNVYDMFYTRQVLHRRAYQHKTSKVIENMITEALIKANKYITIPGKDGMPRKMSECVDDMVAYTSLTDHIYQQILYSTDPMLEEPRAILKRIERRELYGWIGQTKPMGNVVIKKSDIPEITKQITEAMVDDTDRPVLQTEDIIVIVVSFDYGMKDQDPINNVRFYTKGNPNKAIRLRKDQVSQMLPEKFHDQQVRVYCKKTDNETMKNATACFHQWCATHDMAEPKGAEPFSLEMTPLKPTPVKHQLSLSEIRTTLVPSSLNFD